MRCDHAKLSFAEIKFGDNRSTWFKSWQLQAGSAVALRLPAYEESVAVPAMASRMFRLNEKLHARFALDRRWIKQPAPSAETSIDLLESDKVSSDFANHPDDTIRADPPIDASAFVNVIRRDLHGDLDKRLSINRGS